jgi:hypothetical protein
MVHIAISAAARTKQPVVQEEHPRPGELGQMRRHTPLTGSTLREGRC